MASRFGSPASTGNQGDSFAASGRAGRQETPVVEPRAANPTLAANPITVTKATGTVTGSTPPAAQVSGPGRACSRNTFSRKKSSEARSGRTDAVRPPAGPVVCMTARTVPSSSRQQRHLRRRDRACPAGERTSTSRLSPHRGTGWPRRKAMSNGRARRMVTTAVARLLTRGGRDGFSYLVGIGAGRCTSGRLGA